MTHQNKKQAWFIVAFLVLVTAGTIAAAVLSQGSQTDVSGFVATTVPAIDSSDHVRGNASAKVTLIEYGDFECPACAQWDTIVKQIEANYGSKVRIAFRNYPLTQIHQNAQISAQAAEAAGLQGKYWEMHELLYAKQREWESVPNDQVVASHFDVYARQLGLDVARFNTDIASQAIKDRIARDVKTGYEAKIDHTPTFFLNESQIPNPDGYAPFATILDNAIASGSGAAFDRMATTGEKLKGDIGDLLMRRFGTAEMICLPQASAFSLAASRLGWSIQDVALVSLHGRALDGIVRHLQPGARILALSWDGETPGKLAKFLSARGMGGSRLAVLEAMGGSHEIRRESTAATFDLAGIAALNTIALEVVANPGATVVPLAPGLDDTMFEHDGQLTKREVRAVTVSALAPRQGELLFREVALEPEVGHHGGDEAAATQFTAPRPGSGDQGHQLVTIHNLSAAEAFVMAEKAGLDAKLMYDVIRDGAGTSRMFEVRGPIMIKRNYLPATMKVDVYQKDIAIIGAFAKAIKTPTPLFTLSKKYYDMAMAAGFDKQDTAAVHEVLRRVARKRRI